MFSAAYKRRLATALAGAALASAMVVSGASADPFTDSEREKVEQYQGHQDRACPTLATRPRGTPDARVAAGGRRAILAGRIRLGVGRDWRGRGGWAVAGAHGNPRFAQARRPACGERVEGVRRMTARRTRRTALLLAGAALLAIAASTPARADTVTDWNQQATDSLIVTAGQGPTVSVLHLAMVHGAVYDAVNAIDHRHEPYLGAPRARGWYSKDAAAATAAYRVLLSIVPTQQDALDARYQASLAALPEGKATAGGIAVGERSAAQMLAARTGDGRFGPFQVRRRIPAGTVAAGAACLRERPECMGSPGEAVPDRQTGTVPLRRAERARQEALRPRVRRGQVNRLAGLDHTDRGPDRHGPLLGRARTGDVEPRLPPAVLRPSPRQRGDSRFFAMLYLTAADAAISCWDDKAHWGFWRPITAIREAETDGNPATDADPGWLPLLATPPYPDHPSGHGCVSSSIVESLRDFFGTDRARSARPA